MKKHFFKLWLNLRGLTQFENLFSVYTDRRNIEKNTLNYIKRALLLLTIHNDYKKERYHIVGVDVCLLYYENSKF